MFADAGEPALERIAVDTLRHDVEALKLLTAERRRELAHFRRDVARCFDVLERDLAALSRLVRDHHHPDAGPPRPGPRPR